MQKIEVLKVDQCGGKKKRKTKGAQFKETLDFPPKSHMLHICYTLTKTI